MSLFVKLNYLKYDFNESGKWMIVTGPIKILFSEFLVKAVSLVWAAHCAAALQNLSAGSLLGSLPAHVVVLLKDPFGWSLGCRYRTLGPFVLHITYIKYFLHVLELI